MSTASVLIAGIIIGAAVTNIVYLSLRLWDTRKRDKGRL